MTRAEAARLREGEVVEVRGPGGDGAWAKATVLYPGAGGAFVALRRRGLTPAGNRRHHIERLARDVRRPPDPLPANVYADWLEEAGQYQAADMLRAAFPLGPAAEGNGRE